VGRMLTRAGAVRSRQARARAQARACAPAVGIRLRVNAGPWHFGWASRSRLRPVPGAGPRPGPLECPAGGGPNGSLRPVRIARAGHSHRTRARMILPWWARRGQDHGPLRVRLSTRSGPSQFFYSAEVYDHGDRWVQLAGSTGAGGPDSKSAWTGGRSRLTGHHDGPPAGLRPSDCALLVSKLLTAGLQVRPGVAF
jgi:hypothetical protein